MKRPRCLLAALAACSLAWHSPAPSRPDFVPQPDQSFDGFVAVNAPRPKVPVGAIWVNGYGPFGEAAAPDNLETVRSLNGMSIDKGFQLNLSLGIMQLLGLDSRYKDRFTARFTDLALVQVKDVSKLTGPKGEPRIVAALKAGSVVVTTDSELGLNSQKFGWKQLEINGQGASGRTRNFSSEARDVFIAMKIATPLLTRSKVQELRFTNIDAKTSVASLDDYRILMRGGRCSGAKDCEVPVFAVVKVSTHPEVTPSFQPAASPEARLTLPVPTSDAKGGLFDSLLLRWEAKCTKGKPNACGGRPKVYSHYEGTRVATLRSPRGNGW